LRKRKKRKTLFLLSKDNSLLSTLSKDEEKRRRCYKEKERLSSSLPPHLPRLIYKIRKRKHPNKREDVEKGRKARGKKKEMNERGQSID